MKCSLMKCSIIGCPGEYEKTTVAQTFQHNGRTLVIEDIPAEVCSICGDTLLSADTVRSIEQLLLTSTKIVKTVPALSFPVTTVQGEAALG